MADAKPLADKYITCDGGEPKPSRPSVPAIPVELEGWFFCMKCGNEEQVTPELPLGSKPRICIECSTYQAVQTQNSARELEKQTWDLLSIANRDLQEQKILVNEGRGHPADLHALSKSLEELEVKLQELSEFTGRKTT